MSHSSFLLPKSLGSGGGGSGGGGWILKIHTPVFKTVPFFWESLVPKNV